MYFILIHLSLYIKLISWSKMNNPFEIDPSSNSESDSSDYDIE